MMMMLSSISATDLYQLLKHNHKYDAVITELLYPQQYDDEWNFFEKFPTD